MTAAAEQRVAELFGVATTARGDWDQIVAAQHCPFIDRACAKTRKSEPAIAIGTCVVRAGRARTPLIICPHRLRATEQVFTAALELLADAGRCEHHVVAEVTIPGGAVDYVLVATRDGRICDYVGIEFQTLDTSGTVWPHRQRFLAEMGLDVDSDPGDRRTFGVNWKMTAKTILVQLLHKTWTFEAHGRKLVLVLQQELMDYMASAFSFGHLRDGDAGDALHFHPYRLAPGASGLELELGARRSTDAAGIATCVRLVDESDFTVEQMQARLHDRIGPATRWQPFGAATPDGVPDVANG